MFQFSKKENHEHHILQYSKSQPMYMQMKHNEDKHTIQRLTISIGIPLTTEDAVLFPDMSTT